MKSTAAPGFIQGGFIGALVVVAGYIPTGPEGSLWRVLAIVGGVIVIVALQTWRSAIDVHNREYKEAQRFQSGRF